MEMGAKISNSKISRRSSWNKANTETTGQQNGTNNKPGGKAKTKIRPMCIHSAMIH